MEYEAPICCLYDLPDAAATSTGGSVTTKPTNSGGIQLPFIPG